MALRNVLKWKRIYKRRRFQICLIGCVVVIFIIQQIMHYLKLSMNEAAYKSIPYVMGTDMIGVDITKRELYRSNEDNLFKCLRTNEIISHHKVNDNYCDCADGSDEPGTSACTFTKFDCTYKEKTEKKIYIPSSWVNDGICDCCNGADEWHSDKIFLAIDRDTQKKLGRYLSPCPNVC